jgi:hypothetical protein
MRLLTCCALLCLLRPALAQTERVELPLTLWTQVQDALRPPPPAEPPVKLARIAQRLSGRVADDVLAARFEVRFEVFAVDGWLDVPVLDGGASIKSVTLNNAPAVLRQDGEHYVVGVTRPGIYHLRAEIFHPAEALRAVSLTLPEAPTHVQIDVPETGIAARLTDGVIVETQALKRRTRVRGETNGSVHLAWSRAAPERQDAAFNVSLSSLFTLDATVIKALGVARVTVKSGAIDRLSLPVPEGVEVVEVTGDSILQWRTVSDGDGARAVTLLLTHLMDEDFEFEIRTQQAIAAGLDTPVSVLGLGGPEGRFDGVLGVQAPTGLDVQLVQTDAAQRLESAALPSTVTALTDQPLLFGARFKAAPRLTIRLTRNAVVPLAETIIDDLEATTMLLEDGAEISKVRLHMRNNARQHLGVKLPHGAVLSHALIEGIPVMPARDGDRLLVPLQQSTQNTGGRYHIVQPGENLGEIAYIYYSNPRHWQRILNANDNLYDASDVQPGMRLRVPAPEGVEVEESRFVIELAWRIDADRMGAVGQRDLALAELDVDVIRAHWHLYLPQSVRPIAFETAFEQRSARRFEPLDRLRRFIRRGIVGSAQAGLKQRKALYANQARSLAAQRRSMGLAPVIGTRYRFRQLMPGRSVPTLRIAWLSEPAVTALHWGGLFWVALVVLLALRPRSGLISGLLGLCAIAPLLWAGYHVVGTYRHLIWGVNLGWVLLFLRYRIGPWRAAVIARFKAPDLRWLSTSNLLFLLGSWALLAAVVAFPQLCALGVMAGLGLAWIRSRQAYV